MAKPSAAKKQEKRKAESESESEAEEEKAGSRRTSGQKKKRRANDQGRLRDDEPPVKKVVKQICTEGTALKWDKDAGCYLVLHGHEFQSQFDQLRTKQKGGEGAQASRPFKPMCRYYELMPGQPSKTTYATTGCKFREKDSTAVKRPIANEKAVDDGAPCAYACGFSERRTARASACVIGSR